MILTVPLLTEKKWVQQKRFSKYKKKILKKKIKTHFMYDIFDFTLLKLKK